MHCSLQAFRQGQASADKRPNGTARTRRHEVGKNLGAVCSHHTAAVAAMAMPTGAAHHASQVKATNPSPQITVATEASSDPRAEAISSPPFWAASATDAAM